MPTQPPPPRYRVVEQGRRLVVIDTLTGAPATRSKRAAQTIRANGLARVIALILSGGATTHDGHPIVSTKPFYDNNAPRDLVLDPSAQRRVGFAAAGLAAIALATFVVILMKPAVIVVVFPLASGVVQGWLRNRATRWLDEIDAAS